MYAMLFEIDDKQLNRYIDGTVESAHFEIHRILVEHGFSRQQGSVYFGGKAINAVTCVLAAQDLARTLPWFSTSVRDIRMLRIEELNDLMPAIQQVRP